MRHIDYLADSEEPVSEEVRTAMGEVPNLYRLLLHSPETTKGWLSLSGALRRRGALSGTLRELVICYVALLLESTYEWSHHAPIAISEGVTPDQLRGLSNWHDSNLFTPDQRTALEVTELVSNLETIPNGLWQRLKSTFSDKETVELVVTASFYHMVGRVLSALDVKVEEYRETIPPGEWRPSTT